MMSDILRKGMLPALVLISTFPFSADRAQADQASGNTLSQKPSAVSVPYRYHTAQLPKRAQQYYALIWGVDSLTVKSVESGEIVKFTYRVVDAEKAKALNDKKNEPSLVDPRAGVKLVVPSLEKVGQLRQSGTPEVGKVYWMAFSNKGRLVKPGHHVNIAIGNFHADGLVVQ
jgi:hypothetical protein